jgi:hypothetical protein
VSHEKHVKPLINSDKAKDLVVQQTPQLEDESEVPRVGEEWFLLPVAIDGSGVNGLCCVFTCMRRAVEKMGRRLHGCTRRGLFFDKAGGEMLLWAVGFGTRLNTRRRRLVF